MLRLEPALRAQVPEFLQKSEGGPTTFPDYLAGHHRVDLLREHRASQQGNLAGGDEHPVQLGFLVDQSHQDDVAAAAHHLE